MNRLAALETTRMAKTSEGFRDRIDLRATPEITARIEAARQRFGESVSAYIRRAVIERLERDEANAPPAPKAKGK